MDNRTEMNALLQTLPESEADFLQAVLRRNMTPTCASRLGTRRWHKSEKAFQSWPNA